MSLSLSDDTKIVSALDYISANSPRDGIAVDMAGYDSVLFVIKMAAIVATGVNTVKVEQDTVTGFSADPQDLLGTSVTIADDDDDEIKYIDLHQPLERFVRLVMTKNGVDACAESAIAILYNGRAKRPITQALTVAEGERHVAPIEGTA